MVMERIPADGWGEYTGHTDRYAYASGYVDEDESVNDIACGVGYGSTFFRDLVYRGYDRPGVPDPSFLGQFHEADLNDPAWRPELADVTLCFETLEHVEDPAHLARVISETTRRAIFVSVPVVPTRHMNHHHLHNFTVDDVPPMFEGFTVTEEWAQPEELSHVWHLVRDAS